MPFQGRASLPGGDLGYTRPGNDYQAGGSGSGMGTMAQGTFKLGQGLGPVGSMAGGWEPGPLYVLALLVGELIAFHILSRILK